MKKIIIIIILVFLVLGGTIIIINNSAIKLNKTTNIKEDKIKLTVLGSEQITINKPALETNGITWENEANSDYIKVKVSIENYGSETYNFNAMSFYLEKEPIALITMNEEDWIAQEIKPGEIVSGYIYFAAINSNKMTYYTHMEATSENNVKESKYIFKIK